MNDNRWKKSRAAFVAYRATKRELNHLCKEHARTHHRLERAFKQYTSAKFDAENNLDDLTLTEKVVETLAAFQEAKRAHDATRDAFSVQLKVFQAAELRYSIAIFKGLRENHGLKVADLARVFGVYNNQIAAWMRNDNDAEKTRMFNEEYHADLLEENEDEEE